LIGQRFPQPLAAAQLLAQKGVYGCAQTHTGCETTFASIRSRLRTEFQLVAPFDQLPYTRPDATASRSSLSASASLIPIIASAPFAGDYDTSKADISIWFRPDILTLR